MLSLAVRSNTWHSSQRLLRSVTIQGRPVQTAVTASWRALSTQQDHHQQQQRPFDKVLIANRGEIAQRIIRTCQALDIRTVAIHSVVDAAAPFVQAADEAVCVGPAAAALSYLNVPAVLRAVQDTGADAVHPGYGFLSENADFCRAIQNQGCTFLGPSIESVHQMGDKLLSKKLAAASGVNVIPGFPEEVETVQQALQVCNDIIGYPVLLKAAAGGGGKGMRVCYNDAEVKDAWGVARSEALKYFADNRILLEKYIERPHHIEFQVLAGANATTGTIETVVFPERECSIQRRNQKVIEESPSCMLHESTRQAMADQVHKLCQAVGYESAGTVEFLVDEEQNFYFLEMNTRLQVEHPITEAICGVDLVKGMLWVGAGWGLPQDYHQVIQTGDMGGSRIMPHTGHAVEARIYAEDPVRGFLPSIGPLTPYVEPRTHNPTERGESYIRLDSGVAAGAPVTPHYDPMLAKLVSYAPERQAAIDGLTNALDEYVIQGVQHNALLIQSVLRQPSFQAGDTPTSFLPTHYPDGFHGVELTVPEQEEFAVAAAIIAVNRREWLQQPPLAGKTDDASSTAIVRLGGLFGTAFSVLLGEASATVAAVVDGSIATERTIHLDGPQGYEPDRYLANVTLDGKTRDIQVLGEVTTGEIRMQMCGANLHVLIQSPREFELSTHMQEPIPADTSDSVLSPMPGTLISYAVAEGDTVQEGQELCIVEAMKMQNIVRASRPGKIASCRVEVGSSLQSDEIIIEFEPKVDE